MTATSGLSADGELLALHDAYRAAAVPADPAITAEDIETETAADSPPTIAVAVSAPVACVAITWADGEVTAVYPPRPASGRNASHRVRGASQPGLSP